MSDLVPNFLSKFSTDRNFSIPLPFQWTVNITDSGIESEIKKAIGKIGLNSWKVDSTDKWCGAGNILVAQEVTLPNESYQTTMMGPENRGAFMPGWGVTQRADFAERSIVINFLETEKDILSELFKPWLIAISVDGFLNTKLRAKAIDVIQYTRDMKERKRYKFYDAFPTNCEGYTLTYGDQDFVITSVSFGYLNYEIIT